MALTLTNNGPLGALSAVIINGENSAIAVFMSSSGWRRSSGISFWETKIWYLCLKINIVRIMYKKITLLCYSTGLYLLNLNSFLFYDKIFDFCTNLVICSTHILIISIYNNYCVYINYFHFLSYPTYSL